jgi:hypothetical protein
MTARQQQLRDDGDLRKYYASIMHMADDDLDMYEYRLYGHYVRVCGQDGSCTESERTTYTHCGMGQGSFRKAKQGLIDKGFIQIEDPGSAHQKGQRGKSATIVIVDRWLENMTRYANQKNESFQNPSKNKESPQMRQGVSSDTLTYPIGCDNESPQMRKNNKEIKKEKDSASDDAQDGNLPVLPPITEVKVDTNPDKQRSKDIAAIIKIHLDSGFTDRKPGDSYQNDTKRLEANRILEMGFTPPDVQNYVAWLKESDPYWGPRPIPLHKIRGEIKAWAGEDENIVSPSHIPWDQQPDQGYTYYPDGYVPPEQRGEYYDQVQETLNWLSDIMDPMKPREEIETPESLLEFA